MNANDEKHPIQNLMVLVRDDDLFHATPVWMLESLRESLWGFRPINFSAIPYARPQNFMKGPLFNLDSRSDFLWNGGAVIDYLISLNRSGLLGLAMHGWTHLSPPEFHNCREFSQPSPELLNSVINGFEWFESTIGYKVFVPPHNELNSEAENYLLSKNISVCRSIRDEEVFALATRSTSPVTLRQDAKRILSARPTKWPFVVYQTFLFNKRKLRAKQTQPKDLCVEVLRASAQHGLAVMTFHWWDFFSDDSELDTEFINFVRTFFVFLEDHVEVSYLRFEDIV